MAQHNFLQSVVPNGCIELIIHLTDAHCMLTNGNEMWSNSPQFTFLGLFNRTYEVRFQRQVKVFGIRFYPDGFQDVFGIPTSSFLGTYLDAQELLGSSFSYFCERIKEEDSVDGKLELVNHYLEKKLAINYKPYNYARQAMSLIRNQQASNLELAKELPVSYRHLQREFKRQYGIKIMDYLRLIRMNAIHNYMQSQDSTLTQVSTDLDFSDQSHFIREFKFFVGQPPRKFIQNREGFIVNVI